MRVLQQERAMHISLLGMNRKSQSASAPVFSRYRMALKTLDKSANLKCGPKIRHPTHVLQLTEIMSPANPQALVDLAVA